MIRALLLTLLLGVGAFADQRSDVLSSVARLRQTERHDEALQRLREWLAAHPEDGNGRLLLGQVLADTGRDREALKTWRSLLADLPADGDRYRIVSTRLRAMGLAEEALGVLDEGHRRLGEGDSFAWERSELLLVLGRYDEAVAAHLDHLRREPRRRALIESRIADLARADRDAVRQYCDALDDALAAAGDSGSTPATLLLATGALQIGQPGRGLQALRAAIDDEDVLQALFQFATRCEAAGHTDVAATAYGLFATHGGTSSYRFQALLKQAQMREQLGDVDGAIQLYDALAEQYPRRSEAVEALLRVAQLQAQVLGDANRALHILSTLEGHTRSQGLRRRLLSQRADCLVRLDQLPSARAQLLLLAQDEETAPQATLRLAQLAFYTGDLEAAAALADSLVERTPSHPLANDALELLLLIDEFGAQPEALAVLARAHLRQLQDRSAEAAVDWRWLLAEAPPGLRTVARLQRALALETLDAEGALALYEQLLAEPDIEARHGLSAALGQARLLERQGDTEAALRAYEQALLAAPVDPRTPAIRRQIERLRLHLGATG